MPILSYCCEVWSVLGPQTALNDLERVEVGLVSQDVAWSPGAYQKTACAWTI